MQDQQACTQIDYNSPRYIILRLVREYVQPYLRIVAAAVFFMIIVAVCSAFIVHLVEPAIDKLFITKQRAMLYQLPLMMLFATCVKGTAEYFQSYFIKFLGQRILSDLQLEMYDHLLKSDLAFIESQASGRLISRFTNDISLMRGAVSNLLVGIAKHLMTVILLIVLMFDLEPLLSSIAFFVFPAAIYPVIKLGAKLRKVAFNTQEELGNYTAQLDETFSAIRVIKAFSAEKFEWIRAQNTVEKILNLYKKAAKLDSLTSPLMEILSGVAIGIIVWYGGLMIIEGETTPGRLFAFITAFVSAYRPYKSLIALNISLQEGLAAARRVFMVLDNQPSVIDAPNAVNLDTTLPITITLDKVELHFGSKRALADINLSFEPNKMIAIVGESGGGKTSIANLLLRFYDATSGTINFNGTNLSNIQLASVRQMISLVAQDTVLFDATIAENIAYGATGYDIKNVITAAQMAHADEFIEKLSDGYNTVIGNKGFTLSGGQRQRLAIARAIFKNSPIILLDEATSALDVKSEHNIMTTLEELRSTKTLIIITHRITNISSADHIIVMKNGYVAEQGTHDKLMKLKQEYYSLYQKQQQLGTAGTVL